MQKITRKKGPSSFEPDGMFQRKALIEDGFHPETIQRMRAAGRIERVVRGVYAGPSHKPTEHHSLALAACQVPSGVACLLSALSFHVIGTQLPPRVWLAVPKRARTPKVMGCQVKIVRFSDSAMSSGVEVHRIEGVNVKVFSPAKTVIDCFKFRNRIGVHIAVEALREALRVQRVSVDDLWKNAESCRMVNVVRPYLEALL